MDRKEYVTPDVIRELNCHKIDGSMIVTGGARVYTVRGSNLTTESTLMYAVAKDSDARDFVEAILPELAHRI